MAFAPLPTALDDTIQSDDAGDVIDALEGNDTVEGGGGNDQLIGGPGDDHLLGGEGDDSFWDYEGRNTLDGGPGNDEFWHVGSNEVPGVEGEDTLTGGAGRDTFIVIADPRLPDEALAVDVITDFETGEGGDLLDISYLAETYPPEALLENLRPGDNPFLTGHLHLVADGTDTLLLLDWDRAGGELGTPAAIVRLQNVAPSAITYHNVYGGLTPDDRGMTATGTEGDDWLQGTGSRDELSGGGGDDDLYGEAGADLLDGGDGIDFLHGSYGDDLLRGGADDDGMTGDQGHDSLFGGAGDDHLDGGEGDDRLQGGDGDDTFVDWQGSNTFDGGAGDDLFRYVSFAFGVSETAGVDTFTGGAGRDTYELLPDDLLLWPSSHRVDVITDFAVGEHGDRLVLRSITAGQDPFASGHLRFVADGPDTLLQLDRDGAGTAAGFETFLRLQGVAPADIGRFNVIPEAPSLGWGRNDAPTALALSGTAVLENHSAGLLVGTASAIDPNSWDSFSFSLLDDAGGLFAIDPVSGAVTTTALLDREAAASHGIVLRVTDLAGATLDQAFTLTVLDMDDNKVSIPTDADEAANAVAWDAAPGTATGLTVRAADADASRNAVTYTIQGDAKGFAIAPLTGVVTVAGPLEAEGTQVLTVQATSQDGSTATAAFSIAVGAAPNAAPAALALLGGSLFENAANGTVVGTLAVQDADSRAVALTLLDDAGGRFALQGSMLVVADGLLLDREQAASHALRVLADDGEGGRLEVTLTVTVGDQIPEEVQGDARANTVLGGAGADHLKGGAGDDDLRGRAGDDHLRGGSGADALRGGEGADRLVGGTGADRLRGGADADAFVLLAASDSRNTGRDLIEGFARGEDRIDLSALDANPTLAGDQAFRLDRPGTAFLAGEIRQSARGADLLVEINADADPAAEASLLLLNRAGVRLAAGDFDL